MQGSELDHLVVHVLPGRTALRQIYEAAAKHAIKYNDGDYVTAARWLGVSVKVLMAWERSGKRPVARHKGANAGRCLRVIGPVEQLTAQQLIAGLGVIHPALRPKPGIHGRQGFWVRSSEWELLDLLRLARAAYIEAIKQEHPDVNGDAARARWLNAAWARIEQLFKRKGIIL